MSLWESSLDKSLIFIKIIFIFGNNRYIFVIIDKSINYLI